MKNQVFFVVIITKLPSFQESSFSYNLAIIKYIPKQTKNYTFRNLNIKTFHLINFHFIFRLKQRISNCNLK